MKLAESKPTDMNDLFILLQKEKGLDRAAALGIVQQQIQKHLNEAIMTENLNQKKTKPSEALLELIDKSEFIFFHDDHQDAFCKYPSQKSNVYEVRRIKDKKFKSYLSFIYRQAEGKTIGEQALKEAITELEGRALYDKNSKQEKVFLRVGEKNGKNYIDLCNDKWEVIEISSSSWKVLDSKNSPILFERSQHALPLPDPKSAKTGDFSKLWELVNIPIDDRILVLTFILECYRRTTAFPILVLLGLQDSGKSATQNNIRNLIDPSSSNLRTAPRKIDDLVVEAASNWLVSYNNVSSLSDEMHDDFCCIATGSGFATRQLFKNLQQIVVNICRPVVINGIFNFIRRPDMLDRAIIIEQDSIDESKRKTDEQLHEALLENLPTIFRGLMDLFVKVLGLLPNVTLRRQPRMADFALLGVATEKALGLKDGTFIQRYLKNRAEAKENILESSPVMLALIDFIEKQTDKCWRGRPSDLLDQLTEFKKPSPQTTWPKTPHKMSAELKRYTAALKQREFEVIDELKSTNRKHNRGTFYRISKQTPLIPQTPLNDKKTNNDEAPLISSEVDITVDFCNTSSDVHSQLHSHLHSKKPDDIYVSVGASDPSGISGVQNQKNKICENKDDGAVLI